MSLPNIIAEPESRAMTIKDAIDEYQEACNKNDNPPLSEIISALIERGYDQPFQNDSYLDALCLTHVMVERTFSSMRVLTGGGGSVGFWRTLADPFKEAAARLKKLRGSIQFIIINPKQGCKDAFEEIKTEFPTVFDFVLAESSTPISHFMVCDSRMVRVEESHDPITEKSPADCIKAQVNFKSSDLAQRYEGLFNGLWNRLKAQ